MLRQIHAADLRSAARDAEMELNFPKAAEFWEAAIFAYPPGVAKSRAGRAELALMRRRLDACRHLVNQPIGHA